MLRRSAYAFATLLGYALVACWIVGCAGPPDPAAQFAELERLLIEADSIQLEGSVVSEGAFESSLAGSLQMTSGNRARVEFSGEFGTAVSLTLASDGNAMLGGNAQQQFVQDTPQALNEGILLGITRMGILHNLAKLSSGAAPDATNGEIRNWVQVENLTLEDAREGDVLQHPALSFDIRVGGEPSGEVRLWLDPETGLPQRREQVVHFGDADMHVVESYSKWVLNAPIPGHLFQAQGG